MYKRKRNKKIAFWISPEEETMIYKRMSQIGIKTMSTYLRKMALDGEIIILDVPELPEIVSLLRRCSNNLNQVARQVNTTGHLYGSELEQMLQFQQENWQALSEVLGKLSMLK